ncbi:MAG: tRNA uridine-5-carboxymethylaminomethyl(34) synthesis GTPase MnmE [Deltaproteobacteria bacterium]|nr:tRNA uridine-5-carboxymethylaminomethyl(34) synthesis GTPase MnmE [Deltaproteobacteria bacterium]MCL5276664.1 tRNA uridine-5-carboxymethylaminomethyl(34) synthesis GTPase MnmE [Deltaproteobacteria bacterium]
MKKELIVTSDTIAAIATPAGEGAIGIVRISGDRAAQVLKKIFGPAKKYVSHRMYFGTVRDTADRIVDQVMVAFMKANRTYTGEDMVEIYTHGGSNVVHAVLQSAIDAGARLAQRGEFTRRAFLNGKMDLLQAEAVVDLIKADNDAARKQAVNQITGVLSQFVLSIREKLIQVKADIEVMIDFPEEDVDQKQAYDLKVILQSAYDEITHVLGSYNQAKTVRQGISIALIGKPNVGKSSLFNAMLGENRAIVMPSPGTTRDYIEESISYNGQKLVIIDTAGLRNSEEPVEKMGMEMTKALIGKTDLMALIVDPTQKAGHGEEISMAREQKDKIIVVINKMDIAHAAQVERIKELFGDYRVFTVSAKTRQGVESFKQGIVSSGRSLSAENAPVINRHRHKQALEHMELSINAAMNLIEQQAFAEIIAEEIDSALLALKELTGEVTTDEVLEKIFSEFCIGK